MLYLFRLHTVAFCWFQHLLACVLSPDDVYIYFVSAVQYYSVTDSVIWRRFDDACMVCGEVQIPGSFVLLPVRRVARPPPPWYRVAA